MDSKAVNKTDIELKLAQMDREISRLDRLRDAKQIMKRFSKVFMLCFAIFAFLMYLGQQNSAQTVAVIREEIAKLPPTGNATFNESGQMIGINYNQPPNFDEYVTIQP